MMWQTGVTIIILLFVALTSPIVLVVGGFLDLAIVSILFFSGPSLLVILMVLEVDKIGEEQK